jgi:hypothetical protein
VVRSVSTVSLQPSQCASKVGELRRHTSPEQQ